MKQEFLKFLEDIKSNKKISFLEYSVGEKKVDYVLRYNNSNKVFIEVKKISKELDKHQEQFFKLFFSRRGRTCSFN